MCVNKLMGGFFALIGALAIGTLLSIVRLNSLTHDIEIVSDAR